VYIDDIIFSSINEKLCQEFVTVMEGGEFKISIMGVLNYFLGLLIKQLKQSTFLNQSKYCKDLLKKFEMKRCKEAATPISTSCYLDVDEKRVVVDQTKYKRLIGSLLYLIVSIPDTMFNVFVCKISNKFKGITLQCSQENPKILEGECQC